MSEFRVQGFFKGLSRGSIKVLPRSLKEFLRGLQAFRVHLRRPAPGLESGW